MLQDSSMLCRQHSLSLLVFQMSASLSSLDSASKRFLCSASKVCRCTSFSSCQSKASAERCASVTVLSTCICSRFRRNSVGRLLATVSITANAVFRTKLPMSAPVLRKLYLCKREVSCSFCNIFSPTHARVEPAHEFMFFSVSETAVPGSQVSAGSVRSMIMASHLCELRIKAYSSSRR